MNNALNEIEWLLPIIVGISGRLGDNVFYMRGGKICARKHVIPANPRTARQQEGRARFAGAIKSWHAFDEETRNAWNMRAEQENRTGTGYHLFISEYLNGETKAVHSAERVAAPASDPRPRTIKTSRPAEGVVIDEHRIVIMDTVRAIPIHRSREPAVWYEPPAA